MLRDFNGSEDLPEYSYAGGIETRADTWAYPGKLFLPFALSEGEDHGFYDLV